MTKLTYFKSTVKTRLTLLLTSLIFVAPAISQEPNLNDTRQFLLNNFVGKEYALTQLTCEEAVYSQTKDWDDDDGTTIHDQKWVFNPRDVELGSLLKKDSKVFPFQCIAGGKCGTFYGSKGSEATNNLPFAETLIDKLRVNAALLHFQKLCGGAHKTPF